MLIARTLEESEAFIEQELSHVVRLESKPLTLSFNGFTCLVDNENQKLVYFPERNEQRVIKTKKYGSLVLFDRIKDLLESKFNKGILVVYCDSTKIEKKKKVVSLSSIEEGYVFSEIEYGAGRVYINNISEIEPQNAFLIMVERNRFTQNGVQIIDNFKLKTKN